MGQTNEWRRCLSPRGARQNAPVSFRPLHISEINDAKVARASLVLRCRHCAGNGRTDDADAARRISRPSGADRCDPSVVRKPRKLSDDGTGSLRARWRRMLDPWRALLVRSFPYQTNFLGTIAAAARCPDSSHSHDAMAGLGQTETTPAVQVDVRFRPLTAESSASGHQLSQLQASEDYLLPLIAHLRRLVGCPKDLRILDG